MRTNTFDTTMSSKPSQPQPSPSSRPSQPSPSPSSYDVKEVLAYGYLISKHRAGQLAQWYRDRNFPLTTLSHELLSNLGRRYCVCQYIQHLLLLLLLLIHLFHFSLSSSTFFPASTHYETLLYQKVFPDILAFKTTLLVSHELFACLSMSFYLLCTFLSL